MSTTNLNLKNNIVTYLLLPYFRKYFGPRKSIVFGKSQEINLSQFKLRIS